MHAQQLLCRSCVGSARAEILSVKGASYRLKNHDLGARPATPPTS
jgi:hypothetical protein